MMTITPYAIALFIAVVLALAIVDMALAATAKTPASKPPLLRPLAKEPASMQNPAPLGALFDAVAARVSGEGFQRTGIPEDDLSAIADDDADIVTLRVRAGPAQDKAARLTAIAAVAGNVKREAAEDGDAPLVADMRIVENRVAAALGRLSHRASHIPPYAPLTDVWSDNPESAA